MDDRVVLSWILKPLGGFCWAFASLCLVHALIPDAAYFALAGVSGFGFVFGWHIALAQREK
jgi:hypothetical protein